MIFVWVVALFLMTVFSIWESLLVSWAVLKHPGVERAALTGTDDAKIDFRRQEQKYFLESGIYIPLEDIMFVDQLASGGGNYPAALAKGCSGLTTGRGMAIWLPLKVKIPLVGERVKEWCWKPDLRS